MCVRRQVVMMLLPDWMRARRRADRQTRRDGRAAEPSPRAAPGQNGGLIGEGPPLDAAAAVRILLVVEVALVFAAGGAAIIETGGLVTRPDGYAGLIVW